MIHLTSRLPLAVLLCGTFLITPLQAMINDDGEDAVHTVPLAASTDDGAIETPQQRQKKRVKKRVHHKTELTPTVQSTPSQARSVKNTQTTPPRTAQQILGVLKLRLFTQDISEEDETQILKGLVAKSPKDRESFDIFFDVDLLPLFVADRISDEGFYLKLLRTMACSKKTNVELLSRAKSIKAILKREQSELFIPAMERPLTVDQMAVLFNMTIKIQKPFRVIQREAPQPGLFQRFLSKLAPAHSVAPETPPLSPEETCRRDRQKTELLFQNWGGAYCREDDFARLFDALQTKTPDQIKSMGTVLSNAVFALTSLAAHTEIKKILVELVTLPEDQIPNLVKLITEKDHPYFDNAPHDPRPGDKYNPSRFPTNFMLTQIRFWKEALQSPEGIMGAAD